MLIGFTSIVVNCTEKVIKLSSKDNKRIWSKITFAIIWGELSHQHLTYGLSVSLTWPVFPETMKDSPRRNG